MRNTRWWGGGGSSTQQSKVAADQRAHPAQRPGVGRSMWGGGEDIEIKECVHVYDCGVNVCVSVSEPVISLSVQSVSIT